jgi:hypothetical protein
LTVDTASSADAVVVTVEVVVVWVAAATWSA